MRAIVDYGLVYTAREVLRVLLEMEVVGVSKAALRRFARHIESAIADFDLDRIAILKKYATVVEGVASVFHDEDSERKANKEFQALLTETKVSLECIEVSTFEHINGAGVAALMLQLGDLVFDPAELAGKPERVRVE